MRLRRQKGLRWTAAERALEEPQAAQPPSRTPGDPGLAAEVEAMREITKLLEEVPAEAWQTIPAPGADPAAASGTSRAKRPLRLSRALAAAIAVACLALGFGAGALLESGSGRPASAPTVARGPAVVLHPLSTASGSSLAVAYMPGPGQMLLRVARLPPSPPGTYYELWLMTSLQHLAPVAAFQIGSGGQAELSLRLPDNSRNYVYLDISLQRLGAGTAHSADSVLRGRLT